MVRGARRRSEGCHLGGHRAPPPFPVAWAVDLALQIHRVWSNGSWTVVGRWLHRQSSGPAPPALSHG